MSDYKSKSELDFEREVNKQRKGAKESDEVIVKTVMALEFGEEIDNENNEGVERESE